VSVVYYASGGPEAFAEALTPTVQSLTYQAPNSTTTFLSENEKPDTLKPGEYAGESTDARNPNRDFTDKERQEIDSIGQETGCHTCGSKDPGTKSGHFVPDHQPPNMLNPSGSPQKLYPQCLGCSRSQGGQVREFLRKITMQ
jgi:hypothetical protein